MGLERSGINSGAEFKMDVGLDKQTPSYIVLKEAKRDKLRVESGRRAKKMDLEKNINVNVILMACNKPQVNHTNLQIVKQKYYERNYYSIEDNLRNKQGRRYSESETAKQKRNTQTTKNTRNF